MPEQKLIPTTTEIRTSTSGSPNVEIFTFFDPGYFHILSAFIAEEPGSRLGIPYIEGELVITMRNHPQEINVEINANGELIIYAPAGENYSIDNNGDLIGTINI